MSKTTANSISDAIGIVSLGEAKVCRGITAWAASGFRIWH